MNNRHILSFATWIYRVWFPYVLAIVSLPIYFFKYRKYNAVRKVRWGFEEHSYQSPIASNEMLGRLMKAYIKAKADQSKASEPYQVGHLWQGILDTRFKVLAKAVYDGDLTKVDKILGNFNRDDCGYDTCGGYQYYYRMQHVPFYKYQFINSWYKRFETCKELLKEEPAFNLKQIGNPVGMYYQGQIVPLCNLEYHCYASEMIGLVRHVVKPTICEIGGGVGGQAHEVLAYDRPDLAYILLDIPEVLLISSYYLLLAFPEKKFLLYGEGDVKEDDYDAILMPNFVLPRLKSKSVDLFFNSCSFSEMDYNIVKEYLKQIERVSRQYLMHVNHNARLVWYEGKKKITNMIANEVVPNPSLFQLCYKRPRKFELLEDTFVIHLFYKARYYQYLFERRLNA